jgi:O-antigen ligase
MLKLRKIIEYLTYLFLFLLPLQTRWLYKPGFLNGPWEYGTQSLYATEILLGIIILLALIYLIPKINFKKISEKTTTNKRPILLIGILFVLVTNCLIALNIELAFYKLVYLICAASIFSIIALFGKFKIVSWTIISSAAVQTIFAIIQFFTQTVPANKWLGLAHQSPEIIGVPIIENTERTLRAFGTLPHPNILGGFLAIALIINLIIYFQSQKKEKITSLIFFGFNFFGLILTFSRSAILAFIISAIILFVFQIKEKIKFKKIIAPIILGFSILIIFLIPYSNLFTTRLSFTNHVEKLSREVRVSQYHQAVAIFKGNWLLGTGLGNYTVALHNQQPELKNFDLQPIHNTFLLILIELGLPATLLLSILIILLFKNFSKIKTVTCLTCLSCLSCLSLIDHFLWSFYFGLILIGVIASFIFLSNQEPLEK